jgi:hypothetical protein
MQVDDDEDDDDESPELVSGDDDAWAEHDEENLELDDEERPAPVDAVEKAPADAKPEDVAGTESSVPNFCGRRRRQFIVVFDYE